MFESYIGKNLASCCKELISYGAMTTWAPYCLRSKNLINIEIRFNNHWGNYLGESDIDYSILLSDEDGTIIFTELISLRDLASGALKISSLNIPCEIGSIFLGSVSSSVVEYKLEGLDTETIFGDYFYVAYQSDKNYSLVHSQPFDYEANKIRSSWGNYIEIFNSESPHFIIGNPSCTSSDGVIKIHKISDDKTYEFDLLMKPFGTHLFELKMLSDGWYRFEVSVGHPWTHFVREVGESVLVRHL